MTGAEFDALYAPAPKAPEPEPAEEPGIGTSILRGVKQGVTLGFGDELQGVLGSAFSRKTYEQARDEARAADKAAREAHPIGFGLGNIIGGLAPAAATGGVGAGLGASIAAGAGTGIATGIGESEAKGVPEMIQEGARGGLIGGALGAAGFGLGRILGGKGGLVRGAEGREARNIISDAGERATPTARRKIADLVDRMGGEEVGTQKVARILDEHGVTASVAKKPAEMANVVRAAKDDLGQGIADALEGVSMPRSNALRALHKVEQSYRTGALGDEAAADKIARQIDSLRAKWHDLPGANPPVPASEVNAIKSSIQDGAFRSTDIAPKVAVKAERDASRALRSEIETAVEAQGGKDAAASLRDLNERYSVMATLGRAAQERARLDAFPATGLRAIAHSALGNPLHVAHIAASPMTGIPTLALTKGLPLANRAATRALAALSRAARSGSVTAEMVQNALESGVPRGTIEATVSAMTPKSEEPQ